jgi:hypothetical protein
MVNVEVEDEGAEQKDAHVDDAQGSHDVLHSTTA